MESLVISKSGKYLTFMLASEEYGISILKVKEIIGMMEITEMPQMPSYLKGVINLRDRIIPVVDLRTKFSMPTVAPSERTCIIVIEIDYSGRQKTSTIGIIVDEVSEVANIKEEQIESPPVFSDEDDTHFILGMAKCNGDVKILLDIDKVLSGSDLASLSTNS